MQGHCDCGLRTGLHWKIPCVAPASWHTIVLCAGMHAARANAYTCGRHPRSCCIVCCIGWLQCCVLLCTVSKHVRTSGLLGHLLGLPSCSANQLRGRSSLPQLPPAPGREGCSSPGAAAAQPAPSRLRSCRGMLLACALLSRVCLPVKPWVTGSAGRIAPRTHEHS